MVENKRLTIGVTFVDSQICCTVLELSSMPFFDLKIVKLHEFIIPNHILSTNKIISCYIHEIKQLIVICRMTILNRGEIVVHLHGFRANFLVDSRRKHKKINITRKSEFVKILFFLVHQISNENMNCLKSKIKMSPYI